MDKKKALNWITALQTHPGTAINSKELISATNIIQTSQKSKDFGDFNISDNRRYDEGIAERLLHTKHESRIAKHIDSLAKKLGTQARTKVYHSLRQVPKDVREHIEQAHKRGRKVRGRFDTIDIHF